MTGHFRKSTLAQAVLATIVTATAALPVAAQTAKESSSTTTSEAREASTLDAVIVTVERREQDLQKYAGTAQAISADDTRALGINNELRNIQALVPGMSMANQEGNLEIFIRGVGSSNNTELGDPGAAPHINGALHCATARSGRHVLRCRARGNQQGPAGHTARSKCTGRHAQHHHQTS
ncbi:hypothetical protein [uncultured Stenotrophomonas sp.]|uniref:hypothetical protein n=1 Tax=uncultured Stenotrophomonas sp. TaxID=165438 RepID=UPI0027D96CA6|nr:hypothetical protein [uncultured Stenotrophomonas sp.]